MRAYVGLDVHSKTSFYVAQDETGRELGRGEVSTSREGFRSIRQRLQLPESSPVALESGTTAFYAARCLGQEGFVPVVVEAAEVRAKARRPTQKCDSRDAEELCEGLRRGIYQRLVHVPPEEIQVIREALSRRRHFVRVQTAEVNAAKRLLRADGVITKVGRVGTAGAWRRLIEGLPPEFPNTEFLKLHRAMWLEAQVQIEHLKGQLAELGAHHESDLQRLQTLSGVGPIVALTALAVFSDVRRFPTAKHAASYVGLVPRTYHSGQWEAYGHITKTGSPELRAMLVQSAHAAHRPDHPFHAHYRRISARVGARKAIVAVAHRMCRVLYAMLRNGQNFDPARVRVPERKEKHYRLRPARAATMTN
jgi:transposase